MKQSKITFILSIVEGKEGFEVKGLYSGVELFSTHIWKFTEDDRQYLMTCMETECKKIILGKNEVYQKYKYLFND